MSTVIMDSEVGGLLDLYREQTVVFDKPFQFISDDALAYTRRRPGKDEVPDIDREIVGDIGYDLVESVDHEVRVPLLHQLLVLVHAEIDILLVLDILQGYPFPYRRRVIPGFGFFPGKPFFFQLGLDIAGREIDADSDSIVI